MDRRELLALAGIASIAAPSIALAQNSGVELKARLIHIYATPDGESHHQVVEIANTAGEIPVTAMTARAYARSPAAAASAADWHTAPRRQFAINMTGSLEVEISDGSRHLIGQGDLVFLEDITGKGHVTRVQTPVTNLFIHVQQDWDMLAWARGSGQA
jgi:hypothetical protein